MLHSFEKHEEKITISTVVDKTTGIVSKVVRGYYSSDARIAKGELLVLENKEMIVYEC